VAPGDEVAGKNFMILGFDLDLDGLHCAHTNLALLYIAFSSFLNLKPCIHTHAKHSSNNNKYAYLFKT